MFCLRSWIPVLFFLFRTHPSPLYLVLFLSATYFLNRPCGYCSLLLFILVVSVFDFHTSWFEAPLPTTPQSEVPGGQHAGVVNGTAVGGNSSMLDAAAVFAQAANHTAQALAQAAVDEVRHRVLGNSSSIAAANGSGGYDWVKGLMGKKEWRVPCLDVLVRL